MTSHEGGRANFTVSLLMAPRDDPHDTGPRDAGVCVPGKATLEGSHMARQSKHHRADSLL